MKEITFSAVVLLSEGISEMKSLTGVLIGGESIKFASQRRAGQMFDISFRLDSQINSKALTKELTRAMLMPRR